MNTNAPLTRVEQDELDKLKKRITMSIKVWHGDLITIRDKRLYRKESNTFEEFCKNNWGWTRQWVNELIRASVAVQQLPEDLESKVSNLATARAVLKVPEGRRAEVVRAAARNGPVTPRTIAEQAKPILEAKEVFRDEEGNKIPSPAIPFWKRRQEVQDLMTQISRIKCLVEKAKEEGDPLFAKIGNGFIDHMNPAHYEISKIKHYAVCTACMGTFVNGCSFCGNSGLISKHQWDVESPKEKKAIMLKTHLE